MSSPRLQKRRVLSPAKLRAARLKAGFNNVSALARQIGIDRNAYLDWENGERVPLTHVDYVGMVNVLTLFGVTYDDVTDPLPEAGA